MKKKPSYINHFKEIPKSMLRVGMSDKKFIFPAIQFDQHDVDQSIMRHTFRVILYRDTMVDCVRMRVGDYCCFSDVIVVDLYWRGASHCQPVQAAGHLWRQGNVMADSSRLLLRNNNDLESITRNKYVEQKHLSA